MYTTMTGTVLNTPIEYDTCRTIPTAIASIGGGSKMDIIAMTRQNCFQWSIVEGGDEIMVSTNPGISLVQGCDFQFE